jgi:hypothetical protein
MELKELIEQEARVTQDFLRLVGNLFELTEKIQQETRREPEMRRISSIAVRNLRIYTGIRNLFRKRDTFSSLLSRIERDEEEAKLEKARVEAIRARKAKKTEAK